MPEPSERAKQLAESAVDGEGLGPEVLDRIARGMDRAIEEGRQDGLRQAEDICDDIATEYDSAHARMCARRVSRA